MNCANFMGDFVRNDLDAKSAAVRASVAASSLYQGQTDFTGEIRQRYPRIFEELLSKQRVISEKEFQDARTAANKTPSRAIA